MRAPILASLADAVSRCPFVVSSALCPADGVDSLSPLLALVLIVLLLLLVALVLFSLLVLVAMVFPLLAVVLWLLPAVTGLLAVAVLLLPRVDLRVLVSSVVRLNKCVCVCARLSDLYFCVCSFE